MTVKEFLDTFDVDSQIVIASDEEIIANYSCLAIESIRANRAGDIIFDVSYSGGKHLSWTDEELPKIVFTRG